METNYDFLIKGKVSFELEQLKNSSLEEKYWEETSFLNIKNLDMLKSNKDLKSFEFGTNFPQFLDQFQYEASLYHYVTHVNKKNIFDHLNVEFKVEEKAIYITKLNKGHDEYLTRLGMIYLNEKDYEKSYLIFQKIYEKFDNVYVIILLGLLSRINNKLKESLNYFFMAKNKGIPYEMIPSCYMWMGEILEGLKLYLWSMNLYQECVRLIDQRSEIFLWFIQVPFLYLKMGNLTNSFETSKDILEICKMYYK